MSKLLQTTILFVITVTIISCKGGDDKGAFNPEIAKIQPESGIVGTDVTISGSDFSPSIEDNTILFNGVEATVSEASESSLKTTVPDSAETGAVEVTVDGNTASGPVFIVLEEGSLKVKTNTTGNSLDDSYNILVDEVKLASIGADDVTTIDIAEGDHKLELSGIANNCATEGMNPRLVTITAEQTSSISFDVTCKKVLRNHFLFHSDRDGDHEIYAMSFDGSDLQNITNSSTTEDAIPVLSNDGQKVAFVSQRSGMLGFYIMNVDGTNTQLLGTPGDIVLSDWAPDDSELAYFDASSGNADIYILKTDGSTKEQLTTNTAEDVFPSWSPDGNTIVFSSNRDGDYELYTVDTNGSNIQQLTNDAFDYYWARWSPDGSKIAFTSDRDGFAHIYTMDSDGSNITQITSDTTGVNSAPKWSPDGDDILFQSDRDGNLEIYKISADGSGAVERLTNNSATDGFVIL